MITFRILDIFCLSVLGTGWTCCMFMLALKYKLFDLVETLLAKVKYKGQVCYFCIGFWTCFICLCLQEFIAGSHNYLAALLASLCAAPFVRMLMVKFH